MSDIIPVEIKFPSSVPEHVYMPAFSLSTSLSLNQFSLLFCSLPTTAFGGNFPPSYVQVTLCSDEHVNSTLLPNCVNIWRGKICCLSPPNGIQKKVRFGYKNITFAL